MFLQYVNILKCELKSKSMTHKLFLIYYFFPRTRQHLRARQSIVIYNQTILPFN